MPVLSADVDVELDVVDRNNKPPVWDQNVYGPIHIKENVTVGTVVTTVKARFVCHDMTETRHMTCRAVPCSAVPPISFSLFLSFSVLTTHLSLPPSPFILPLTLFVSFLSNYLCILFVFLSHRFHVCTWIYFPMYSRFSLSFFSSVLPCF